MNTANITDASINDLRADTAAIVDLKAKNILINTGGVSLNSQSAAPYGMKILTEGTADLSYSLYADGEVHIKAGNMLSLIHISEPTRPY